MVRIAEKTVENAHIISAEPNYRDGGNSGNLIAVMGELNNRDGEPNNRDGVPNNRDGAFHGEPNNRDGEPNKRDGRWGGLWPAPENSFLGPENSFWLRLRLQQGIRVLGVFL